MSFNGENQPDLSKYADWHPEGKGQGRDYTKDPRDAFEVKGNGGRNQKPKRTGNPSATEHFSYRKKRRKGRKEAHEAYANSDYNNLDGGIRVASESASAAVAEVSIPTIEPVAFAGAPEPALYVSGSVDEETPIVEPDRVLGTGIGALEASTSPAAEIPIQPVSEVAAPAEQSAQPQETLGEIMQRLGAHREELKKKAEQVYGDLQENNAVIEQVSSISEASKLRAGEQTL